MDFSMLSQNMMNEAGDQTGNLFVQKNMMNKKNMPNMNGNMMQGDNQNGMQNYSGIYNSILQMLNSSGK